MKTHKSSHNSVLLDIFDTCSYEKLLKQLVILFEKKRYVYIFCMLNSKQVLLVGFREGIIFNYLLSSLNCDVLRTFIMSRIHCILDIKNNFKYLTMQKKKL